MLVLVQLICSVQNQCALATADVVAPVVAAAVAFPLVVRDAD